MPLSFLKTILTMRDRGIELPRNASSKQETDIGQVTYFNHAKVESVVQLQHLAVMSEYFGSEKDGENFGNYAKYKTNADGKYLDKSGKVVLATSPDKVLLPLEDGDAPVAKIDPKSGDQQVVKAGFSIVTTQAGECFLLVSGHFESGKGPEKELMRHMQREAVLEVVDAIIAKHLEITKVVYAMDSNQSAAVPRGTEAIDFDAAIEKPKAEEAAPVAGPAPAEAPEAPKKGKTEEPVKNPDPDNFNLKPTDFVIDKVKLKQIACDLTGENLILEQFSISNRILKKMRLWFNFIMQQQSTKGDMDWSNKSEVIVCAVKRAPQVSEGATETVEAYNAHKEAQAKAIDGIINNIVVPKKPIIKFDSKQGYGVDHDAATAQVYGLTITAQPLIKTNDERGFRPATEKYTRALTAQDLADQQKYSRALVALIIAYKHKDAEQNVRAAKVAEIEPLLTGDFGDKTAKQIKQQEKKSIQEAGEALDEMTSVDVEVLLHLLVSNEKEANINSKSVKNIACDARAAYEKVAKIFKKDPLRSWYKEDGTEVETFEADEDKIAAIADKVAGPNAKKGQNKRLDTLNESFRKQIGAGFDPIEGIRKKQLNHLYGLLKRSDIVVTTEDGPENHEHYDFEMNTLFGRLEQRTFSNIATRMVIGAGLGAGVAFALSVAMPVIAGAAAGMALLSGLTYYASCGASKVQTELHNKQVQAKIAAKAAKRAEKDARRIGRAHV